MYLLRLETDKHRSVLGEDKVFHSFPELVEELKNQLDCPISGGSLNYCITHTSWKDQEEELKTFLKRVGIEIRNVDGGYELIKKSLPHFFIQTHQGNLVQKFLAKGVKIRWSGFISADEQTLFRHWRGRRSVLVNPEIKVLGYSYDSSLHCGRFNTNHKSIRNPGKYIY